MEPHEILQRQDQYVLPTYSPELLLVKGSGCNVWDSAGKKYLDFSTGISVCSLGHCHPVVTEAIQRQAAKLVHVSNLFVNENQPQLAATIAKKSFGGRVFFANSGAEANEGMIKFARKWGSDKGRHDIICMTNSFHGRTLTALAATGQSNYREGFGPDATGFKHVEFNDLDAVSAAVTETTAAVLMEPIQGEGGIVPASPEFVSGVRELCDRNGILLLFDEVQCGMGRTGRYFAYQHFGVEPDAMALAKALGNGFPLGAFEVQRKWEGVLTTSTHASTFGGTPLACAAGLAVFQAIDDEDLLINCQEMGEHLRGALIGLVGKYGKLKEVRGHGLMLGVEATAPVAPVLKEAADSGLLVLSAGKNVLRLLPPLTIRPEHIDEAIKILDSALEAWDRASVESVPA